MATSPFKAAVLELIVQASDQIILPRFQQLEDAQVSHKNGTELVTVADIETENFLVPALEALWPGSRAMGEETVAEDPSKMDWVADDTPLWIIDPIDGTRNFAAGRETFCVMIARLENAAVVESWLYHPTTQTLYWALARGGAWKSTPTGETQLSTKSWAGLDASYGRMAFGFFDKEDRIALKQRADRLLNYRGTLGSAGCEYCLIADGASDYSLFNRMKVWDHAPGSLLVREAGGTVLTVPGAEYSPQTTTGGMVVASSLPMSNALREILFFENDKKRPPEGRTSV